LAMAPLAFTQSLFAWTPGTSSTNAVTGFVVSPTNRLDVLSFYNAVYVWSEGYATNMAWNGNVDNCIPGTTSTAFKNDVMRRVNFYRALVALPGDITNNTAKASLAQDAALIFSRNAMISHVLTNTSLGCWSMTGSNAAANSNIGYGT